MYLDPAAVVVSGILDGIRRKTLYRVAIKTKKSCWATLYIKNAQHKLPGVEFFRKI
jgi:hypothetical protein